MLRGQGGSPDTRLLFSRENGLNVYREENTLFITMLQNGN